MHTFIVSNLNEDHFQLEEGESKHAIKVLRLSEGKEVRLIDGKGNSGIASIISAHPKRTELSILRKTEFKPQPNRIAIGLCPTKSNDRTEFFLEKSIEIGLTDFYPLVSKNSERVKFNIGRLERIAESALKQSHQLWKTRIHEPVSVSEFVKNCSFTGKFIAHCEQEEKVDLFAIDKPIVDQIVLIGPEGDFTREEIQAALLNNFKAVSLGKTRLRTETAGIVATTALVLS